MADPQTKAKIEDPTSPGDAKDFDFAAQEQLFIARTLYGEARGESLASKTAVAWVIRNRVESGFWGKTYQSVVTARLQFTCWSEKVDPGNFKAIHKPSGSAWTDCEAVAATVMKASADQNPLPGATHYYSPKAQAALHKKNAKYPLEPAWTKYPSIKVTNPPGVPPESFAFYKNVLHAHKHRAHGKQSHEHPWHQPEWHMPDYYLV